MPFVVAGIASVGAGIFGAGTVGASIFTAVTTRLLTSVAISALQTAFGAKSKAGQRDGIQTDVTQTGATNSVSWIMGKYATAGVSLCPPMSHGKVGKTPNSYLTYVINLSDIPGMALNRVAINGSWVTLGGVAHPDFGLPVTGIYTGFAWVKYYNGSQVAADPMLLAKYGAYPNRPWTSDMIGRDMCYAIWTFRINAELFTGGFPAVLHEVSGIPVYDIRQDSTAGGSGLQRWADRTTWVPSNNPFVNTYNVLRGVRITAVENWGGQIAGVDIAGLVTAMNVSDIAINLAAGGTEPQFRVGLEVFASDEPASIIEQFMLASAGDLADIGGVWKGRAGGVGLPVYMFTDDDVIVTQGRTYDPFPAGLKGVFNAAMATYPEPISTYQTDTTPQVNFATYEAEDQGRRLVSSMSFSAVTSGTQAQRLCRAFVNDNRKFRRHSEPLPPAAMIIEPLDAVSWSSIENGYSAKVFEVEEIRDDILSMVQGVSIREKNSADYSWTTGNELPYAPVTIAANAALTVTVQGFDLIADAVTDAISATRRPRLKLVWDGAEQDGVTGYLYEIRVAATGTPVKNGSLFNVPLGEFYVAEGILPSTSYEARMLPITTGAAAWTAWDTVTSLAVAPVQMGDIGAGAVNLGNMVGGTYGGAAENPDPNFTDRTAWNYTTTPNIVTLTDGVSGRFALRHLADPSSVRLADLSQAFAVDLNKSYTLRALYRKAGAPTGFIYFAANYYDANNAFLSSNDFTISAALAPTVFTAFVSPTLIMPANTAFVRLATYGNRGSSAGQYDIQAFRLDEQIGAALILDGSVSQQVPKQILNHSVTFRTPTVIAGLTFNYVAAPYLPGIVNPVVVSMFGDIKSGFVAAGIAEITLQRLVISSGIWTSIKSWQISAEAIGEQAWSISMIDTTGTLFLSSIATQYRICSHVPAGSVRTKIDTLFLNVQQVSK